MVKVLAYPKIEKQTLKVDKAILTDIETSIERKAGEGKLEQLTPFEKQCLDKFIEESMNFESLLEMYERNPNLPNGVIRIINKTFERMGAYILITGLWETPDEHNNQLMRNMEIVKSFIEVENGIYGERFESVEQFIDSLK